MPIASDPNAKRTYILRSDRDRKVENPPKFFFRYLTRREKTAYSDLKNISDEAMQTIDADELVRRLYERLKTVLVDWSDLSDREGTRLAYYPEHIDVLDSILTDSELWELYHTGASDISFEDRDFFDSPPTSPTDGSAEPKPGSDAAATPGNAPIPQPSSSPMNTNVLPVDPPAIPANVRSAEAPDGEA